MGLGGIYAGIGLAQGLGQAGKSFVDSYQTAQENARKKQKEDLEMKISERDYQRKLEADQALEEANQIISGKRDFKSAKLKDEPVPTKEGVEFKSTAEQGFGLGAPLPLGKGKLPKPSYNIDLTDKPSGMGASAFGGSPVNNVTVTDTDKVNARSQEVYDQDIASLTERNDKLKALATKLVTLTNNPNLGAYILGQAQDYMNDAAAELKGYAGKDVKKLSQLINVVSGNQGISVEELPEARKKKDDSGYEPAYVLKDARGFAIGTVSPLELSELNTGASIKTFMAKKTSQREAMIKMQQELAVKKSELDYEYDLKIKLEGLKGRNAQILREKINKNLLEQKYLETFGISLDGKITKDTWSNFSHTLASNQKGIYFKDQNGATVPVPQDVAMTFVKTMIANPNGNMNEVLSNSFGKVKPTVTLVTFGDPPSTGTIGNQRLSILKNRLGTDSSDSGTDGHNYPPFEEEE